MAFRNFTKRDAVLMLLGALCMHTFSSLFAPPPEPPSSIVINTHLDHPNLDPLPPPPEPPVSIYIPDDSPADKGKPPEPIPIDQVKSFPETTLVSHAPGWTIFRNLYMADGTLFIVSSQPPSSFPDIRYMTSVSMWAYATPENIAAREPTNQQMDFLTPEEAKVVWGGDISRGQKNRVWSVEGNTLLFNDPDQFLNHYYHFVAELLVGTWAFWSGTFNPPTFSSTSLTDASTIHPPSPNTTSPPPIDRAIFAHSTAEGWRDGPGFNSYFIRSAFPSLTIEAEQDWNDRISSTRKTNSGARAWHFPVVLLADRSAAFRGQACGHRTQRTAAEAYEAMANVGRLRRDWWEPVRRGVLRFAGIETRNISFGGLADAMGGDDIAHKESGSIKDSQKNPAELLPMPERVVITYISRQGSKRHLVEEDHLALVDSLENLANRKGWHLNVVQAERLTKDEQVRLMGETTIMLGVHGNGLTHLVLMPPTRVSAVIEIFFPGGFAHDYEWTTRALGMRHFAVWNDTYHSYPKEPRVDYPEGFQGTQIPAHGPSIAKLIEDRIEGRM